MSQLFLRTSLKRDPLLMLSRFLSRDRVAYLQLLLHLSTKSTFSRILRCPTYPLRVITKDLSERRELFLQSLDSNASNVALVLANLYEVSTVIDFRKGQGQFFTPDIVAQEAVSKLGVAPKDFVLDPGCGTGIFPITLLKFLNCLNLKPDSVVYLGIESDPILALGAAIALDTLMAPNSWKILFANYLNIQSEDMNVVSNAKQITSIICNPPYVRFHRLGQRTELTTRLQLPSQAGLQSFFIEKSISLLPKSKMIFILPIEMRNTTYGSIQMNRLRRSYKIENETIYFDTKSALWKITAERIMPLIKHTAISRAWDILALNPISKKLCRSKFDALHQYQGTKSLLDSFSRVHRGIATGANAYFVIDDKLAKEIGLNESSGYLTKIVPTKIPRTELKSVFRIDDWDSLKRGGKACWLITLPQNMSLDKLPTGIRRYLKYGERLGIHLVPTCLKRNPWYCVPISRPPQLFFTYFSRGFPIFIRNEANAHNLTNLLGVYITSPGYKDAKMEHLTELLNEELEEWIRSKPVGRRYQGGLIKFEPRDLLSMPVSQAILSVLGVSKRLKID